MMSLFENSKKFIKKYNKKCGMKIVIILKIMKNERNKKKTFTEAKFN